MAHAHDDDFEEPPFLRRLRMMVMVLIVVLILGVLAIAATIVIRLGLGVGEDTAPEPITAETIALPEGHEIVATGQGPGTVHVVLRAPDGAEVLILFDEKTGAEISRTPITRN